MSDRTKWSELDDEENLTVEQLSTYLQISASKLNKARMVRGNGPKYWKMGNSVRYKVGHVREWIEDMTRQSTRVAFAISSIDELPDPEDIADWLDGL